MSSVELNILDKGVLAWDREGLPFNSHLAVDFEISLDSQKIHSAYKTVVEGIPLLRTVIVEDSKGVRRELIPLSESLLSQSVIISENSDPKFEIEFRRRPFDLAKELPFRVMYGTCPGGGSRLIMTIHHSAADGLAQVLLLSEFFRAYEGQPLSNWTHDGQTYRMRDFLFKTVGLVGALQFLSWFVFRLLVPEKPKPATLIKHPENPSREVSTVEIVLGSAELTKMKSIATGKGINAREYFIYAWARALDRIASANGDDTCPVVLAIPLSFRMPFGHFKYLQNAAGITRIVFNRNEIRSQDFPEIFKRKLLSRYSLKEGFRGVFLAAIGHLFFSTAQLRAKFRKFDEDPNAIFSTSLVSMGRIPKNLEPPKHLKVKKFSGYMTLFKNPGLGITMIGTATQQTLSIHYLSSLIDSSTVDQLKQVLLQELGLLQE